MTTNEQFKNTSSPSPRSTASPSPPRATGSQSARTTPTSTSPSWFQSQKQLLWQIDKKPFILQLKTFGEFNKKYFSKGPHNLQFWVDYSSSYAVTPTKTKSQSSEFEVFHSTSVTQKRVQKAGPYNKISRGSNCPAF